MCIFLFRAMRRLASASLAAILLFPSYLFAGPILPGFDLFMTIPRTFADLGPPFGPLDFRGLPIGPGPTDTIVRRNAGTTPGFDFGSAPETIPIEIVALSLVSVAPVELAPSSFFDVFVTLDGTQQIGSMTVSHENPNGGTMDTQLPVSYKLTFVQVSGPPIPPPPPPSFFDIFFSLDVPWSHTPPPHDKHNSQYPAGGFHPIGPITEQGQLAQHRVIPAVPEPGTLALLGAGLALLGFGRGRARKFRWAGLVVRKGSDLDRSPR